MTHKVELVFACLALSVGIAVLFIVALALVWIVVDSVVDAIFPKIIAALQYVIDWWNRP